VVLCVAQFKRDIPKPCIYATTPRNLKHLSRSIHTDHVSFHRDAGGFTGGLACTATDIEHSVAHSDTGSGPQMPVVP